MNYPMAHNTLRLWKKEPGRISLPVCLIFIGLMLSACMTVGPDYVPPQTKMPGEWLAAADPAIVPGEAMTRRWWTVFDDPLLTRLIEEAAAGNLDLKTAVARVKEARARLRFAAGEHFPQVDATGDLSRQRSSENLGLPVQNPITDYRAGVDSSWEIDLFGRISRSVEAAAADYEASEEDRIDVMVSVYAEMTRSYLTVRTLQARLAAIMGNIESQKQVVELTKARFRFGLATDLDVAQAEDVLASSEAQVPPLRSELVQAVNAIALLHGKPPGVFRAELMDVKPIPVPPPSTAVGIPADLLRQRPDVRRAERTLAAQTARIGVATADLYPRFSLLGTLGLEATSAGDFFTGGSHFYGFGPSLRWNLFDAGRIRSQIKVADALTEQALLQYEQTVLRALGEVENTMTAYLEERKRREALERSVAASRRTLTLAIRLYKDGLRDFQGVLDAQRTLFNLDDQLAQAQGNIAINLVQLYKALGGGWDPKAESGTELYESRTYPRIVTPAKTGGE